MITYILFYIAVFFTGDESMLALSFLSAQGYWSIYHIFIICILANVSADICWFLFGDKIINKINKVDKYKEKTRKLFKKSNWKKTLFASKFVYGTRVLTVTSLGINSTPILPFIILDTIALIPITIVILSLGWFAGKGSNFINAYKSFQITILILVIFIFLVYLLKKWLNKKYAQ